MKLDERLQDVAIIGAAGKMGKGISSLILSEMALTEVRLHAKTHSGNFQLHLIDTNEALLASLSLYLRKELGSYAEKNIQKLRKYYSSNPNLIDNGEMIEDFVDGGLSLVRLSTLLESAKNAFMIFEAIVEDESIKQNLFKELKKLSVKKPYFFTNTSSIPIHVLDKEAKLEGHILGYHFYNPPVVQKLIEIIPGKSTHKELVDLGNELGKRLGKIMIPSSDAPGFIGNGHFMRDILFGCALVDELNKEVKLEEALLMVNTISESFMIRPMGIFQLIDYVGIDVVHKIFTVMNTYTTGETFAHDLITNFLTAKIYGGQDIHGAQKDGIFKYEKGKPIAIFSLEKKSYVFFAEEDIVRTCQEKLGILPSAHIPWKVFINDKNKHEKLKKYFSELFSMKTLGALCAQKYLLKSKAIAKKLVETNVADSLDDVNTVLEHGFFHAYGPSNDYY